MPRQIDFNPRCLHVDLCGVRCSQTAHSFGGPSSGFYGPYCQQHESLREGEWEFCKHPQYGTFCKSWVRAGIPLLCTQTSARYYTGSYADAEGLLNPNRLACPKCKVVPYTFYKRSILMDSVIFTFECYKCKHSYSVEKGDYR